MRFNFKIQQFQTEAVDAVIRVFSGQPKQERLSYRRDVGKYGKPVQQQMDKITSVTTQDDVGDIWYRNVDVVLDNSALLKNIREIQMANNIKLSHMLVQELGVVSLDVEMETGTGKTYVYIKTMFELNKCYGWSEFIVVVPSVAIREGVKKSFEMTQEHFMELYGIKARFFVYNSSNLCQLDKNSSGFGINVMIINIQAFATSFKEDGRSKESRIIYSERDELGSRRPIDVIKANRPIIILDEPHKMSGAATQNALKNNFNPLFSLNYSATHKTSHNLVYVLDALDAFQKKLVKKIEVKGFEIKNLRGTDGYLYLEEIVLDHNKPPRAKLELEVKYKNGIKRESRIFNTGDSLFTASNELEVYKGLSITDVDPFQGVVIFSNGEVLTTGNANGNISENDERRIQIRETINSHFDKEETLFKQGIKCLSLFFIDKVEKYRQYSSDGAELLGEYGKIFEQEYTDVLNKRLTQFSDVYQEYLKKIDVNTTHRGYFSIDKQGRVINSEIKRGSDVSDDISAYDLILKGKERLLSFDEPTRFIFSHSALREGWDNPNVFQICTLKRSDSAVAKRQEVGRGLRLCVNQIGDRQDIDVCGETLVHEVNKLTVIASESYVDFVADLQSKIREDLYERPTKVSIEYFTNKQVIVGNKTHTITVQEATAIYNYLIRHDYIDDNGVITSTYRSAVENNQLAPLKNEFALLAEGIHKHLQAIFDPNILNDMIVDGYSTKLTKNPINENFFKQEFQALWKAINGRYAYTVNFDSNDLIEKSIKELNQSLHVTKLQYILTEGVQIDGTDFDISRTQTQILNPSRNVSVKYDLIGKIAEATTLTRYSVMTILKGLNPDKLCMFRFNPEEFIQRVAEEINKQKAAVIVEHICYQPSAEQPYTPDIFNISKSSQEFTKAYAAKKAIQNYVFTDGTAEDSVERKFVKEVDTADEVVVYAKLPRGPKGFSIPTPVGDYSPDWAIAFKRGTVKHIFFIAETKGTMDTLQLRPIEQTKIKCAKKLFNEISTSGVKYHDVDSYKSLLDVMQTL